MQFLDRATRNLFFTGKGGVGKTSLACAAAVALADRGKRVLLVSTDPASNLDEVLGVSLGSRPAAVPDVPGLSALNIDPDQAARVYRERVVGPYRGVLPGAVVAGMEEQLSGACTVEIAAFEEFARLLANLETAAGFDHVVFDTAPTGHTLRLLALPAAWAGFIQTNATGTSCLGPLAGLGARRGLYEAAVAALSDASATTLVLVSRPEAAALAEGERCRRELGHLGVANQHLVINGVFTAAVTDDPVAVALEGRGREALRRMPAPLAALPRTTVPLAPVALLGVAALRALGKGKTSPPAGRAEELSRTPAPLPAPLESLLGELARDGRGVILTMGKGGVGKTTIAAAVAVELARRGHPVHLTTTDPAAHVEKAVGTIPPGLRLSRIDPAAETRRHAEEVLATAGAGLDSAGLALLREDLRSPCTEEVAVFQAFARIVAEGRDSFVVLDTAPTGHTLLLLDAAQAYHREVSRRTARPPDAVAELLPRLRDAHFTRVLIVTVPEATPVHEAAHLQEDLVRAGIRPFAWVINQSFAPLAVRDPLLRARQAREAVYVQEVADGLATRVALVPWQLDPPAGEDGLRKLLRGRSGPLAMAGSAPAG